VRAAVDRLAGVAVRLALVLTMRIIAAVKSALPKGSPVEILGASASDRAPNGVYFSTKESANLKAHFVGFLSLLLLFCPLSAFAEGWDHLPGDRVVITVKNHTFVFPSQGYDLDHIRFNQASLRERATLRDVIAAPEKEREIFAKKTDVIISVSVGPNNDLFLNQYDRAAVESLGFSFYVGKNQLTCQLWAKEFDRVRAAQSAETATSTGLWREFQGRNTLIYTYSGPKLDGVRSGLQNVYCDGLSYCGSALCLAPDMGFDFKFSSMIVPQQRWVELLRKVDTILSSILEAPTNRKGDSR
jgi:hypothetical protein